MRARGGRLAPAMAGSARRAASADHGAAPTTAAELGTARARIGRSARRLSPTTSPTDRAPDRRPARGAGPRRVPERSVSTISGVPRNLARRSSRWVAIPVGHVSRWHWRAMSQPIATSADVPNANSSAPDERGDQQVTTGLQPAVGAQRDAVAQVVPQQDLVDLGQAELPRRADVLDRRQRRRAGPAGVPRQVDVRRTGLGDARRDRPDAAAGDELHADPRRRVDRPQVGDELGQVLDRVDVVVRRRADVALAGLPAPQRGDVGGRLATGQLAALARLRALGDLDLELVGARQVRGGHPEPRRGDLLDPGVAALGRPRRPRTTPDPRRLRRCWRHRRRAGCRSSAPGAPRATARRRSSPTRRTAGRSTARPRPSDSPTGAPRRRTRSSSRGADGRRRSAPSAPRYLASDGVQRRRLLAGARRRPLTAPGSRSRCVGANRCASPSARNRAKPGSGNRASRPGSGRGQCQRGIPAPQADAPPRSSNVVRPGHAPAIGKQRPIDVGRRGRSCRRAPRRRSYAIALMPIRARVLRSPAAKASARLSIASAGVSSSAPRVPASSRCELDREPRMDGGGADGEGHGHRVDVEDVRCIDHQVRPTAEPGLGQRGVDGADGEDRRHRQAIGDERRHRSGRSSSTPASLAATASPARRSSAAPSPAAPTGGDHVASSDLRSSTARRQGVDRADRRGPRRSAAPGAGSVARAAARRAVPADDRAPPAGPSRPARVRGRWPGW